MVKRLLSALLFALALPAMAAMAADELLLEAELDTREVHVHAQAVYRLRFLHAVDVRDVQIAGPSVRLADLRKIGEDRISEAQRGGKRYRVHERRYAVFPFASGTLELSGAYVTGRVPSSAPEGWRQMRIAAPARTLTVLPVDIAADGAPWLPASAVALTEQWTTAENGVYRRTVRIEASGVDATQLPELDIAVEGMGVLPGTPRLRNTFTGERNIAVREQAFVIMPTQSGLFAVPPLQLRWWNVDTDTGAIASLPGRTLVVGESAFAPKAVVTGAALEKAALGHLWAIVAASLGAGLLFAALRRRRLRNAWQLRQACRAGDLRAVRDGLLAWAATALPDPPATLGALAERMHDAPVRNALLMLERSLYGPDSGTWSADALAELVAGVRRGPRRKTS